MFPDAGLGIFFKSPIPYGIKGGTLIAVHYGQDNKSELTSYRQGMAKWGTADYADSNSFSRNSFGLGSRANDDGFDKFNLLLIYHKSGTHHRMKLLLSCLTLPGRTYERLVNYDIPHAPPSYWNESRSELLAPTARTVFLAILPLCADQERYKPCRRVPEKESNKRNPKKNFLCKIEDTYTQMYHHQRRSNIKTAQRTYNLNIFTY